MFAGLLIASFKYHAVFFLQAENEFEGIDGVQAKAIISKKQGVVINVSWCDVFKIHRFDDEGLQFLM